MPMDFNTLLSGLRLPSIANPKISDSNKLLINEQ
jgi:hypothetical protein